jgi:ATP-binding cassette, subfamily B, bacterial MsbA
MGSKKLNFFTLVKPYKFLVIGAVVSLMLFSNLGLAVPWMLKIIIDKVLPSSDFQLLYVLSGVILIIYFIRSIMRYFAHYLIGYAGMRVLLDVRQKVFRHLQTLSLRFYEEYRTGKLISNVITDVALMQSLIGISMQMADKLFLIVVLITVLLFMNVKMALLVVAIIPFQVANFYYFKRVIKRDTINLREKMSEISANLAETLSGVKVIKSFAMERAECRSFFTNLRPTLDMSMKVNMKGVYCGIISDILSLFCIISVMILGTVMIGNDSLTIGEFVAFYTYVGMLLMPINIITTMSTAISQGLAGCTRIMKLLNTIPDIADTKNAKKVESIKGDIEFRDVTFGYDDKPVIRDFSLKINAGQKVALVGPSGCGKSTISNLLLRFYDISEGQIYIDGNELRKMTQESYRNHVGVVLQEPFLFSGTIRENIAYARRDATDEEIEEAARMANVEEFVSKLDDGLETEIGENGASLSGGQKQRLAIARAILRNPTILILDEATSALDTVSEHLVQEALDYLMEGKTTIIIAHRLSTIRNSDIIVVMENGRIKQKGPHQELLEQDGIYQKMYTAQENAARQVSGL